MPKNRKIFPKIICFPLRSSSSSRAQEQPWCTATTTAEDATSVVSHTETKAGDTTCQGAAPEIEPKVSPGGKRSRIGAFTQHPGVCVCSHPSIHPTLVSLTGSTVSGARASDGVEAQTHSARANHGRGALRQGACSLAPNILSDIYPRVTGPDGIGQRLRGAVQERPQTDFDSHGTENRSWI